MDGPSFSVVAKQDKLGEEQGLLLTSRQVAKLLKVSERTLWKMQTAGERLC